MLGMVYGVLEAPSTEVLSMPSWINPSKAVPFMMDWPTTRWCHATTCPPATAPLSTCRYIGRNQPARMSSSRVHTSFTGALPRMALAMVTASTT
jgi:hypothetical protein